MQSKSLKNVVLLPPGWRRARPAWMLAVQLIRHFQHTFGRLRSTDFLIVFRNKKIPGHRPTLPCRLRHSTIGAGGLNYRVRDGNGCCPSAMGTRGYILSPNRKLIRDSVVDLACELGGLAYCSNRQHSYIVPFSCKKRGTSGISLGSCV